MDRITTTQGIYGPEASRPRQRLERTTKQRLGEARAKLAVTAGASTNFSRELLTFHAQHQVSTALAVPLLATAVAAVLPIWMSLGQVLSWLAIVIGAGAIALTLCRQFLRADSADGAIEAWRGKIAAAEFLHGAGWSLLALSAPARADPAFDVFIFAVLVIVLAARSVFAASVWPIVLAGTLPITAAVVLRFSSVGDVLHWAMAALAVGAQVYFVAVAMRLSRSVAAMAELRGEKDALIAELEQVKATSEEARRRAEDANLAKSRFLATMSHELRTPLNAILGFSELMKNEAFGPHQTAAYKDDAADINASGQHLLNLINEILDLSRIEAGRYQLNEEPIRLDFVVDDCRRLVALRAREKQMQITASFEHDLPEVWADERALRQICLNLLSNAIKFTPAGGQIVVKVGWTEGGGQYLSVKDNGPGIPEDEIPHILSSFGQGSLAQKTAEQGAGLGLPIVQGLVALHGGAFDLRSKLREGTEVIVTLPRARVMTSSPRQPEESHTGGDAAPNAA